MTITQYSALNREEDKGVLENARHQGKRIRFIVIEYRQAFIGKQNAFQRMSSLLQAETAGGVIQFFI